MNGGWGGAFQEQEAVSAKARSWGILLCAWRGGRPCGARGWAGNQESDYVNSNKKASVNTVRSTVVPRFSLIHPGTRAECQNQ